jgi:hypothetical protein
MKTCGKCGETKSLTEFPITDHYGRTQSINWCINCCEQVKSQRMKSIKVNSNRKKHHRAVTKYKQSIKGRASDLLRNARVRACEFNREFNLTRSFIISKLELGICEKSGIIFDFSADFTTWQNPFSPSIDRKDNSKGYTIDNVQVVCTMFNVGKSEHSEIDFIAMCLAVAEMNSNNEAAIARMNELCNAA